MSILCYNVYVCVDMFSHHETNNIFEIRCVEQFFGAVYYEYNMTSLIVN
jgi:hypothetical protein